jgi:hypothetical protein
MNNPFIMNSPILFNFILIGCIFLLCDLSFPWLIEYNRRGSSNSYDSVIDGSVSEVFGAKSARESFL